MGKLDIDDIESVIKSLGRMISVVGVILIYILIWAWALGEGNETDFAMIWKAVNWVTGIYAIFEFFEWCWRE